MTDSHSVAMVRWGILGTGAIARQFAEALTHAGSGTLVCVATRAAMDTVPAAFGNVEIVVGYDNLLARDDIDAVYIATPHPSHAEWAIKAVKQGKHVLCEKPLALNAAEAHAVFDAARQAGRLVVEAFMYRTHPQTQTLVDLIKSGKIGRVRLMTASYGYNKPFDPTARHYSNALGGGAILDIGCYCVSMARLVAGAVDGRVFSDPVSLSGNGNLVETGADENAAATMKFANGMLAQIACSITTVQDNCVRIYGDEGWIEVASPWFCSGRQGGRSSIIVHAGGKTEEVDIACDDWLYTIEADAFAASVGAMQASGLSPAPADSLGNMRALDEWRRQVGVVYAAEKPRVPLRTFSGETLRPGVNGAMPMSDPLQIGKPLSKLALGCMGFTTLPDAQAVYDAFFEAGGNVFDTAHIYKAGLSDTLLGHWMAGHGVREDMVVIGKGAHSPNCYPETIGKELRESLERLQTDYIDIYFLHRDNLEVPVGEFVDVLDDYAARGMIRAFGGSNWSLKRFDEANAYAARTGRRAFSALSNQFSLAEMLEPVWADCVSASDAESVAWLRSRNVPLFAWSSQARGFFTDSMKPDDPAMVKSWLSEKNLARRDRAETLARRHGVSLPTIALAYVLGQTFPVFPIIGPLTIGELRMSLPALDVKLSPDELAWLENGDR
jgi:predicted dehydrogenase/aryl-alcohol dehydrogenase-like predicted oxidoreductase